MVAENWFAQQVCDTTFTLTGVERTVVEYRDRDGAWWYRGEPSPLMVERREVRQRQVQETSPDGTVTLYWETV